MAYSDLNYVPPKMVKAVFGLSEGQYTKLAANGGFRFYRKYKNPLILMDSLASFYSDRDNYVLKRWGYDYETPKEKYQKMYDAHFKGYPRCFFKVVDVPDAYYRVFYRGEAMKLCVFVIDGFVRIICFDRTREHQIEDLFFAFEQGKIDIEG